MFIQTCFCVDSEREALNRLQPATVPLLLNRENNKVHNTLFFYVVEPWTSITRASSQEGLFWGSLLVSCGQYYGSASLTQKLVKRLVEGGPYDHVGNPHQNVMYLWLVGVIDSGIRCMNTGSWEWCKWEEDSNTKTWRGVMLLLMHLLLMPWYNEPILFVRLCLGAWYLPRPQVLLLMQPVLLWWEFKDSR